MMVEESPTAATDDADSISLGRERWSSRLAFFFVSTGAAIGYGNVWRFPSLAYKYGGGAFFIPYWIALFIVGIPILCLELTLGQVYQQGDVGAFGGIHKRLRGIGLTSIQNSYFIVVYYCALIAWTLHAFFKSFQNLEGSWEGVTGAEAYSYFKAEILGLKTVGDDDIPTRLVPENVGCLFLGWLVIFLCVGFGIRTEGRITYFTMGFPIIMLLCFLVRSVTLEGAGVGIKSYIGEWDVSVLTEMPDVWSTAVSQIFFSIGVTFGIMTAFGSHCERNAPAFLNSVIIALCNSFYSFVAGFAVFAALGYISVTEDIPIEELDVGGPALLFGTYPVALSTLPGGKHWVRFLFITLFMLGIDSAFALLEGSLTVVKDSRTFGRFKRWQLALVASVMSFFFGLLYVTDAGLYFLDVVDFYINFIMILVGFFETFAAGWIYGIEKQIESIGSFPVVFYMAGTMLTWMVASILWFNMEEKALMAGWLLVLFAYIVMAAVLFVSFKKLQRENSDLSMKSFFYDLLFRNVFDMCDDFSQIVGFLPKTWALLIKHILPPLLLILFINLASTEVDGEALFGNYEGYPDWPYQTIGIFIVALSLFLFALGVLVPDSYLFLVPQEETRTKVIEMKEKVEEKLEKGGIEIPLPDAPQEEAPSTKEEPPAEIPATVG